MSKEIKIIEQIEEGGLNPKSNIREEKLWKLYFEDESEPRTLGRTKMLEYLSKGTMPPKTAFSFKKWDLTIPFPELEEVNETYNISIPTKKIARTWAVVYDDKRHIQLISKDFYALITNGHKNKDKEKKEELNPKVEAPPNPALFTERITTPEEKEELKKLRENIDADEAFKLGLHLHDDEIEEIKKENK